MSSSEFIYLTTKLRCKDSVPPVFECMTTFGLLASYFLTCVAAIVDVSEMLGGTVFRIWLVTTTLVCIVIPLWFMTFKCVD